MSSARARLLAFYLPQFHPIPENNEWWGKGFTEWSNVLSAQPLFAGHYQPHLPANLGIYDLRVPEVRQAQADLARQFGVEGFCYWHYWFNGRRLLERPFQEVLQSGAPDFPFCLAWANETWSRRWLGEDKEILLKQTYSAEDDLRHARWLAEVFRDRRYVRVEGRPLFLIYHPSHLPDLGTTLGLIRTECAAASLPDPFLVGICAHSLEDFRALGLDANLHFEPELGALSESLEDGLKVFDYVRARKRMAARKGPHPGFPCIMVSWDNTPRRGKDAIVFINATPEHFETGLREMVDSVQETPPDQRLVFVNAWNEWGEGNHLEPDMKHGLAFLEAIQRVVMGVAMLLLALVLSYSVGCSKSSEKSTDQTGAMSSTAAAACAWIKAEPNPVPAGSGMGTTKISWDTGNGSAAQVYLLVANQPETLFAAGHKGEKDAPWISKGHRYEFLLYASTDHQRVLARITVTRD
jgi:hypothetical protein